MPKSLARSRSRKQSVWSAVAVDDHDVMMSSAGAEGGFGNCATRAEGGFGNKGAQKDLQKSCYVNLWPGWARHHFWPRPQIFENIY